jgi:glucan biosynthesis protein C
MRFEMRIQTNVKTGSRLSYLDNLRIYLTILVILHHTAIAYGGNGSWAIIDPAVDEISPIFLTIFNALNQSYFMTAFFLLAGYFTPRSLEKKGARRFLSDRLVRLGFPILLYTTIIININAYIIGVYGRGLPFRARMTYDSGHLWFLQLLLVFAVIYLIYKWLTDKHVEKQSVKLHLGAFPSDKTLVLTIAVLSLLTFMMRLIFPVGKEILNVQPGHIVHYSFAFFVGIAAYRRDWFQGLSRAQGRRWGKVALAVFPTLFVLMILGGALESDENVALFLGGFHWQSFVYAIWETIMMIGIIVFLLYFFCERINRAGPTTKTIATGTYTTYIIHQTILFTLNVLFLSLAIPTIVKFIAVSLIAVPLSFLLSVPIRKLPYASRVLG